MTNMFCFGGTNISFPSYIGICPFTLAVIIVVYTKGILVASRCVHKSVNRYNESKDHENFKVIWHLLEKIK